MRYAARVEGDRSNKQWVTILAAVAGCLYGLSLRFTNQYKPLAAILPVMSVAFVLLVPLAIGWLMVALMERRHPRSYGEWIILPWLPVLASLGATLLFAWEGIICIVMMLPLSLFLGSLGGLLGGWSTRSLRRSREATTAFVLLLPLLVAPWEHKLFEQREMRTVENTVEIHASPQTIWRNIERVPAITPSELAPGWTTRIGFPAPVEATLSHAGVGGVRHASFAGNVI